ncbi:hypothetical protein BH23VER1_BH23VER1_31480 [soil metagenome]
MRLDLAEVLGAQGKTAEALELVEGVLGENPFDGRALALKARYLRVQHGGTAREGTAPGEDLQETAEPAHGGCS